MKSAVRLSTIIVPTKHSSREPRARRVFEAESAI
jgi:hypothetical protein